MTDTQRPIALLSYLATTFILYISISAYIISASLAIRIAERSSIVMEHLSSPSVRTYALWQNG